MVPASIAARGNSTTASLLSQSSDEAMPALDAQPEGRVLEHYGLQLSTVTRLMLADFEGTLREVAEVGYDQVEFSALGFLGRGLQQVQQLLEDTGLQAPVGRVTPLLPADIMQMSQDRAREIYAERGRAEHLLENVTHALENALVMGQTVLNLPALMPGDFQSLDQVKRNIERMNEAGALCAAQGVRFGYHNHDWEFKAIDGQIPYDLMLEQTDADKVSFQLDVYWIAKAGKNFSEYLSRYAGRFNSGHLKDMDEIKDFADVGHGVLDMPRFVNEATTAGAEYFFVERDNPPDPASSMRRSYAYLRKMTL